MITTTAKKLRKEQEKQGALNELIAPCAFINEHTVLTKRGDIFSVLEVKGIDAECLEPEQIDDVCRRFDSALRILGSNYRVIQYLIKRNNPEFTVRSTDRLERARESFLAEKSDKLFSVSLHLVVLRMRPMTERAIQKILDTFFMKTTLTMLRRELSQEAAYLEAAVQSLCVQLASTVKPRVLDTRETLRFLSGLVNLPTVKANALGSVPKWHLDQILVKARINCEERHLEQDEYKLKILSMVEPPSKTFPHLLRGLLAVECNMIVCSEWKRESNYTIRKEIDQKRRHYHLAKSSMWSYLGNSKPKAHEILLDDSKTAVVNELNLALEEMELRENFFGRLRVTICLFHESHAVLTQAVSRLFEIYHTHDAKLVEETLNLVNAWASLIPGNYHYGEPRQMLIGNQNHADLSLLFQPAAGEAWNNHLNQPALAKLETKDATLFDMNLQVGEVGHTLLIGSTGSGKSFLSNFCVSSFQKYEPFTYIFDLGGSYKKLTSHYKGGYLHIGKASDVTINPFSLEQTQENLLFLFDFVRVLVQREGASLTDDQEKDLFERIKDLYELEPEHRTLKNLARTCKGTYNRRLNQWIGDGRLAEYFDHAEDNLTLARFQAFDFHGMDKSEVLEPLLFYILHRATNTISDPAHDQVPKLFVLDEAWRFFNNPITRKYIHEGLKTWRKYKASMIIATQSANDLLTSQLMDTVMESCMTRMFLANPGMNAETYRKAFDLSPNEAALVAKLEPQKQFLFKQPAGAKVLSLNVDPASFNVFSVKGRNEEAITWPDVNIPGGRASDLKEGSRSANGQPGHKPDLKTDPGGRQRHSGRVNTSALLYADCTTGRGDDPGFCVRGQGVLGNQWDSEHGVCEASESGDTDQSESDN